MTASDCQATFAFPNCPLQTGRSGMALGAPEIHLSVRQDTVSTRISAFAVGQESGSIERRTMKWVGTYLVGFVIVIGAVLAALWRLGVLQNIETIWIVIGVAALVGLGIMISVPIAGSRKIFRLIGNRRQAPQKVRLIKRFRRDSLWRPVRPVWLRLGSILMEEGADGRILV